MVFTASTARACKMMIATTFAFAMLTTASQAYTPEQEQMCTGDAMRLCGEAIPDVERVTACMIQKRSMLSDGCKAVFQYSPLAAQPVSYAPQTKPGKPINLAPYKRG